MCNLVNAALKAANMESPFPVCIVPCILAVLTIITFALVWSVRKKPVSKPEDEAEKPKEQDQPQGSVFVADSDGHVIRRSSRLRKPTAASTETTPVKSKPEGAPKTPAA
ncbi:hypothetical protein Agub_g6169, partial [Astrephomene gubernaculifera]